ncbi:MAG: cereblon family protein [Pseudomonadales bacterium]|nr:cereblon family protein [Pseudomonadales bacterium]
MLRERDRGPADGGGEAGLATLLSRVEDRAAPVRCRACGTTVTRADAACAQRGSHAHRFVNPAGITFDLRCYRDAPGCIPSGEPDAAHSWFPPARWTLAHCAGCGVHLGWFFDGAGTPFVGLIADRIDLGRAADRR